LEATINWRESFLKEQLNQLEVSFVDSKSYLVQAARLESIEPTEYYGTDNHLTAHGNSIVAKGIAREFRKEFLNKRGD